MVELEEENKTFGVFKACNLKDENLRSEILEFVKLNKFFVLIFQSEECKKIKGDTIIRKMEKKHHWRYAGIVLTIAKIGMERFKDTFHRSNSYVDQNMFCFKEFKKIFEEKEDILTFFDDLSKEFGEFQIKGMKQILLRKKVLEKGKIKIVKEYVYRTLFFVGKHKEIHYTIYHEFIFL